MPRSLADGHTKVIILTSKPTDPKAPTVAELTAVGAIDASCAILSSDFTFGPTDSDKVAEKALCTDGNANALGASNYAAGFTLFRYFDATTKNGSTTEDKAFAAMKTKGTELWIYARKTAKKSTDAVAAADELFFGAWVVTDNAQPPSDQGGYIKVRIPMEVQDGYPNIVVAA